MQTNTIIFDLGGVLIDWNPRYLYRKIFAEETEMEFFLKNITTSDWNEEQDAGRSLEAATQILIHKHPGHEVAIRAFYDRWPEMLGGAIEETVAILKTIKQNEKYALFALTNWSAETWPIAIQNFPFLQWFEGILVSGEEYMKKPDPRIYQLLGKRFDLDLSKALFIDDNIKNVTAAIAEGLPAIHFSSAKNLKEELQRRDILE